MNEIYFTKPGAPIDECAIALEHGINSFISASPNENHQNKIATYAQDSSETIVAGILGEMKSKGFCIQGLWVANAVRRLGVGTKLLHLLEEYLQKNNVTMITLETTRLQLMEFYIKNAYELVESEKANDSTGEHYILNKSLVEMVE